MKKIKSKEGELKRQDPQTWKVEQNEEI